MTKLMGDETMKEIMQYLKKNGEQLDTEIAVATGISLASVRLHLAELTAQYEIVACHTTRFVKGKSRGNGLSCSRVYSSSSTGQEIKGAVEFGVVQDTLDTLGAWPVLPPYIWGKPFAWPPCLSKNGCFYPTNEPGHLISMRPPESRHYFPCNTLPVFSSALPPCSSVSLPRSLTRSTNDSSANGLENSGFSRPMLIPSAMPMSAPITRLIRIILNCFIDTSRVNCRSPLDANLYHTSVHCMLMYSRQPPVGCHRLTVGFPLYLLRSTLRGKRCNELWNTQ